MPILKWRHKYTKKWECQFSANSRAEEQKFRSTLWRRSLKKAVLKNCAIFTGKHLCWSLFFNKVAGMQALNTAKNTVISPNFLVWTFCGKTQFSHSFEWISQNYEETVPFYKISTRVYYVKLPYYFLCSKRGLTKINWKENALKIHALLRF